MQKKITEELNGATEYLRAMIKTGAHKEDCENVMMHLANIDDIINENDNIPLVNDTVCPDCNKSDKVMKVQTGGLFCYRCDCSFGQTGR